MRAVLEVCEVTVQGGQIRLRCRRCGEVILHAETDYGPILAYYTRRHLIGCVGRDPTGTAPGRPPRQPSTDAS